MLPVACKQGRGVRSALRPLYRARARECERDVEERGKKVVWVGRATVFLVGLAVILALVLGVTSMAFGANGDFFKVGRTNLASAVSVLTKSGAGPALSLNVDSGPSLKVNSAAKVAKLNADELDGLDSTNFAPNAAEPWHEVGAAGEPPFASGTCTQQTGASRACAWQNFSDTTNSAAFFKDPFGVVHLKGLIQNPNCPFSTECMGANPSAVPQIFVLPAEYRPAKNEVQVTISTNNALGRCTIKPDGRVIPEAGGSPLGFFSLDGIAFRAGN